jgi:hypothetical protein
MRIASEQARAMAARDTMDHEVGRSFQERMRKAGFGGSVAIENVGAGYHTLADAFSGWRDSPPHQLKRAEKKRSEPFPSRAGATLKTGRPVKAAQ